MTLCVYESRSRSDSRLGVHLLEFPAIVRVVGTLIGIEVLSSCFIGSIVGIVLYSAVCSANRFVMVLPTFSATLFCFCCSYHCAAYDLERQCAFQD